MSGTGALLLTAAKGIWGACRTRECVREGSARGPRIWTHGLNDPQTAVQPSAHTAARSFFGCCCD